MKIVEKVELANACDQNLVQHYARALRGELKAEFEKLDKEAREAMILEFEARIEKIANKAFEMGRDYQKKRLASR